jgi:integral membrane protein (TIGR01906 family)
VRRAETLVVGLALAVLLVGLAVFPLTQQAFTRIFSGRYSLAEQAGLPPERMLAIAEQVRTFVTDNDSAPLPATVDGRPGFDAAAVSHLVDVRRVLMGSQVVTGLLAALVTIWLAVQVARRHVDRVSRAMMAGAIFSAALVVLALVAGLTDFESLFTAFHGMFFSAGTWTFPADSLLIQTFPEPFWVTAGVAWAVLVLIGAGALALGSRWLRGGDSADSARPTEGGAGTEA